MDSFDKCDILPHLCFPPYASAGNCTAGSWIPVYTTTSDYNNTTFTVQFNTIGWGWAVKALNGSDECVSRLSNCVFATPTSTASVNLTGNKPAGWDHVVVPTDNVCNATDCVRSATLSANATASNFNYRVLNNSSEDAGANGAEYFDVVLGVACYYGLLIYKTDSSQVSNSINYTISMGWSPSNLRPSLRTGWTAQVVPRNAGGCDIAGCLVSATLPGWAGTTYINSTSTNDGPNPVNTAFQVRYLLDDISLEEITFASLPVSNIVLDSNNTLAGFIKGGRHTLGMFVDSNNTYLENNETDNTFYRKIL